jgi:hypothetical protein
MKCFEEKDKYKEIGGTKHEICSNTELEHLRISQKNIHQNPN